MENEELLLKFSIKYKGKIYKVSKSKPNEKYPFFLYDTENNEFLSYLIPDEEENNLYKFKVGFGIFTVKVDKDIIIDENGIKKIKPVFTVNKLMDISKKDELNIKQDTNMGFSEKITEKNFSNINRTNVYATEKRSKIKRIVFILLISVLIVSSIIFINDYFKYKSFINNVLEQNNKLLQREDNIIPMISKFTLNDFINETNKIIDLRNELINKIEIQKSIFFNNKLEVIKNELTKKNEELMIEQEERFKKELSGISKTDNIAFGDFVQIINNKNITWQELFDKLEKFIKDRESLMDQLKNMEHLSYKTQIMQYVKLLEYENNFIRSFLIFQRSVFNYLVDLKSSFTSYSDIKEDEKEIADNFSDLQENYKIFVDYEKTIWEQVKGLIPSRDILKILDYEYNVFIGEEKKIFDL